MGFADFWGDYGPAIGTGAGLITGGIFGRKAEKNAMQRTPEEQLALRGAQGVGGTAAKMGLEAYGESKPYLRQAGSYYSTLLNGNRAAMSQAVAPSVAQITGNYRGAQRGIEGGLRGAARDYATAGLNRQRASQIAGLTTGVQPGAADALAKLGTQGMQFAAPLLNTSGNVYTNLLAQGAQNRQYGRQEGEKTSGQIGGFVRDIIGKLPFGKGSSGNASPGQQAYWNAGNTGPVDPGTWG